MAKENDNSNLAKTLEVLEPIPTKYTIGKSIAFTGHLSLTRERYQQLCEQAGMRFEKAVRYGLTYLCTNRDWNSGSTAEPGKSNKLRKAEEMGVKVISEQKLLDLLTKTED